MKDINEKTKLVSIVAVCVLFVGASVIPSTVGIIEKKTTFIEINPRGYIQELIDNASTGDTIYISSGIYYENIVINKSISLVGEDKDTTIIDGSGFVAKVDFVSKVHFLSLKSFGTP